MAIEVRELTTKSELKRFVKYPFKLYRNSEHWVPPLVRDELTVFNPRKNPAFQHCEIRYWMAFDDGKPVGRIAGILHQDEAKHQKLARFGWIDFVDDPRVSAALLSTVENWAKKYELKGVHGPMGFTDLDFEGMLIDGFDSPATIATIYNYPYYPRHLENLGYKKSVDWVEMRSDVPTPSKRLLRRAEIIENRFGLKSLKFKNRKEATKYGKELFDVLNAAFAELYGFHQLSEEQITFYIEQYLGFVVVDFISLIVNDEGKLVGFAITMPSFTKAFQKARGSLLPFGVFHILRALKKNDTADMYLIGVLPEYQRKGATALIFRDLMVAYNKFGIKRAISNQMLEENNNVLAQFNEYQANAEFHKRRRAFKKDLTS